MAQLTDDCFAFGGSLMPLADALAALQDRVSPVVGAETVGLADALGRVLAEPVIATLDVPPHDNAAVDGYAVFFDDLAPDTETTLPVTGRAAAGQPFGRGGRRGEAVRIFTGAAMPAGFDTVMMQEDCVAYGGTVAIRPGIKRGANRRRRGEDVSTGATVLSAGRRLRPQDVAIAAAVGRTELIVHTAIRVAIFSTGDELAEPGQALAPGAIYDSNRHGLKALLAGLGCHVSDLGILVDREDAIRNALADAATNHDVIVTSGGMSVGDEDHVKAAVSSLGRLDFWQIAIKPGRPIGLGQVSGVPFVGLPGNPAAMMVTFFVIARPVILRLAGVSDGRPAAFPVQAGFGYKKKSGRREYVRVRLVSSRNGTPVVERFPREGAGILSSIVDADGLVEIEEERTCIEAGETVHFLPFSGLDH